VIVIKGMAERVGFEPTLPFRVNTLSKRAPSATRPSLRKGRNDNLVYVADRGTATGVARLGKLGRNEATRKRSFKVLLILPPSV
jgi:hypothetical protein